MLIGYEANNALRNSTPMGDFCRDLIEKMANRYIRDGYRALLFTKGIKKDYRGYFSGNSNVSSYLPVGMSKLMPELWMRYRLNAWLKEEKVKLLHGLNEELPYNIGREVKTVVTCYGIGEHHRASLMDSIMWKSRLRYAFTAADAVVAVSEDVKRQLLEHNVSESKIVVIGVPGRPYEASDEVVEQYYSLYRHLLS